MSKESFGKTWWGNAWIEILEDGVKTNPDLLSNAKANVQAGKIIDISIENSVVEGKFEDKNGNTFHCKLIIPKLNGDANNKVKSIFEENPAVLSELSLGKLDEKLPELLSAQNLSLFPDSFENLDISCSCSDHNRPCIHILSLFYALSAEMDKNPLIALCVRNISTEFILQSSGPLFEPEKQAKGITDEMFIGYDEIDIHSSIDQVQTVDLSFHDLNIKSLFTLLSDNPLFYSEENFKLLLIEKYKALSQFVDEITIDEYTNPKLKNLELFLAFIPNENLRISEENNITAKEDESIIFLTSDFFDLSSVRFKPEIVNLNIPTTSDKKLVVKEKKLRITNLEDMLNFFISQPLEFSSEKVSPSAAALNLAASISLALVKTFSFIPELVPKHDGSFFIHYIPLIHEEKIQSAINTLESIIPDNLIMNVEDNSVLKKEERGIFLLSLYITHIVRYNNKRFGRKYFFFDQKVYNAFFQGELFHPEKFDEKSIAKAIVDWLERLSIRSKEISPVIILKSIAKGKYAVLIEIENKQHPELSPVPLKEIFTTDNDILLYDIQTIRADILRQLKIISDFFPQSIEYLNNKGMKNISITSEEMFDFVTTTSETLRLLGIKTIFPKHINELKTPKLIISAKANDDSQNITYLSLKDILTLEWKIEIGDTLISVDEFYKLSESSKGILQLNGQYFVIHPDEIEEIFDKAKGKINTFNSLDIIKIALTGEFNGKKFSPDEKIENLLKNLFTAEEANPPSGLKAKLRPYQLRGFKWLYSNYRREFGSLLADDMGLGKTIQVISLIQKLKEENESLKPVLVICPTTLVGNWYKEILRFAPELKMQIFHGSQRKRLSTKNINIVLSTYGIVRSDLQKFQKIPWEMVILDEAQNIKNPDAEQTKAVKQIPSAKHIALSGTPIENRLSELWSIFDFLNKEYLGSLGSFKNYYALPIEKYRNQEKIEKLKKITAPFILRRLKTDPGIVKDLPDKVIFDEFCYLSEEQTILYSKTVQNALDKIRLLKGFERKGMILTLITHLKQICNHPAQFDKSYSNDFSLSGKTDKLIELLGKMLNRNEKIVVFTQFKQMGDLLVTILTQTFNEKISFFHGGLSRQRRDQMVIEFQEEILPRIMILSLKAGGTGLNLTAAVRVIHYDLWWNPAVESQATDRVYRIGQTKNVTSHRMITLNTFEEKIDDMLKKKTELSDLTISTGESWITELSDKELKRIFKLA